MSGQAILFSIFSDERWCDEKEKSQLIKTRRPRFFFVISVGIQVTLRVKNRVAADRGWGDLLPWEPSRQKPTYQKRKVPRRGWEWSTKPKIALQIRPQSPGSAVEDPSEAINPFLILNLVLSFYVYHLGPYGDSFTENLPRPGTGRGHPRLQGAPACARSRIVSIASPLILPLFTT